MVWDWINREKLSPMMQHYVSIKEQYPECLILYRLGDFYEMFFDDAITGSKILELTLTSRDCGLDERCPMAGVPHHVIETYAGKLVAAGHKVCIVDQMEDPKQAIGLVKREVTRILTPGTLTESDVLDQQENNFLLVVFFYRNSMGLCYADLSTGTLRATELNEIGDANAAISDWVESIHPSEIILVDDEENREQNDAWADMLLKRHFFMTRVQRSESDPKVLYESLTARLTGSFPGELRHRMVAQTAIYTLFQVVYAFRKENLAHLSTLEWVVPRRYMHLNAATRDNLELVRNLEDGSRRNTLFSVLDHTKTAMGSRKLAEWINFPLTQPTEIEERLDRVAFFKEHRPIRLQLRELLDPVYDLERLLSRLSFGRGNGRDLLSFGQSIAPIPEIMRILQASEHPVAMALNAMLDPLDDLHDLIVSALVDEPPIAINEGGLIREGYDASLDALRSGSMDAREELLAYEQQEKERTGIKNLRVVFRRNQGYFIEITRSNLDQVPSDYIRKQTLKNAERFTTPELEHMAQRITGRASQIEAMEYEIFVSLRERVAREALRIRRVTDTLSLLDATLALSVCAEEHDYVRPRFNESGEIHIQEGRHPVVETVLEQEFIANDLHIGSVHHRIQVITGPNMAGKSTYMRQNALILIMGQMGSFVPAASCELPLTDSVFTRIGARDHLARGESTFMVEMREMADILEQATPDSFLVLDEIGRGTSTNDGMAIAQAILEYLSVKCPAKTLFATHYHELSALSERYENIENRSVQIEERDGRLLFLRKVIPGSADRSYGIEVARLSGLPDEILDRASTLLSRFEARLPKGPSPLQLSWSVPKHDQKDTLSPAAKSVLNTLRSMDVNAMTPILALQELDQLVRKLKEETNDPSVK